MFEECAEGLLGEIVGKSHIIICHKEANNVLYLHNPQLQLIV
jgi:hypothetical protein